MRHLENLPNRFNVPIRPDKDGYLGRECPVKSCRGYFKITPGTGVKGPAPCHCPYCGHSSKMINFTTTAQIGYAKSIVIRQVTDALLQVNDTMNRPFNGRSDSRPLEYRVIDAASFLISVAITREQARAIFARERNTL